MKLVFLLSDAALCILTQSKLEAELTTYGLAT